ncbi:hypothetical protein ACA910_015947 [Epithemia clementina (nom. ined.)]
MKFTFTPCKRSADRSPDELDEKTFRIKLAPVTIDLGDQATPAFQRLTGENGWARLVKNAKSLHATLGKLGESASVQFNDTDDTLSSLEYKVSALKTLLGDRPDTLRTSLAFEVLEALLEFKTDMEEGKGGPKGGVHFADTTPAPTLITLPEFKVVVNMLGLLEQDLKQFKSTITGIVHLEMQQGFQDNLYSPGSPFQLNLARPTIGFLKDWSTAPSAPGDKLAASLQQLENKIGSVKADVVRLVTASSSATGGATTAPVFGANHGVGLSQPTAGLPSAFGWSTQAARSSFPTGTQQTTGSGPSAQFETEVREGPYNKM